MMTPEDRKFLRKLEREYRESRMMFFAGLFCLIAGAGYQVHDRA